jgi:hypothetical protein
LRYNVLVESLLSAGLLLLNTSVLVGELVTIKIPCDLLEESILPLLARESRAEELGRSGDDLADLRIFGGARAEGLLLVLGVQDASHAEDLPLSLELGGHVRLGKIEPFRACGRLLRNLLAMFVQQRVLR